MGFELVGLILGAYYLGTYLDDKYQGNGLYFVGISLAVLVGWLVQTLFLLSRFAKEDEKEEQNEKPS
jgi:hypothetical protein